MSASAAIVYKGQANRVNFDGYPELMFPALEWRSEDEVNALVTGREIRALGEPGKNPPSPLRSPRGLPCSRQKR
ncbi:MAG: hypothetical protein HN842_10235 [Gammaproteobacteria bacterium]|nr:hypothetical protein [Gammaproteobacteria bacterium]